MLVESRTDSSSRSATAAVAVAPVAFVGGLAAMRALFSFFDSPSFLDEGAPARTGNDAVIGPALVVMLLSVAAAIVAGEGRRGSDVARASFLSSLIAAVICAPVTMGAMIGWEKLVSWASDPYWPEVGLDTLSGLVTLPLAFLLAAVGGVVFSVPLGMAFATFYAAMLGAVAETRERWRHARRAITRCVIGGFWAFAGLLLLRFDLSGDPMLGPVAPAHVLGILGLVALGSGVVGLARVSRWVRRVGRGEVPGWALEPPIEADVELPNLLPWLSSRHATLVRSVAADHEGPFRSSDGHVRLARVGSHAPPR